MNEFASLAMILGAAAVGGIMAKILKQPVLLGYIVSGAVITAISGVRFHEVKDILELMGQLGVTLLLFLVGLELPISELKKTGKVALATGLGQIIFTSIFGYILIRILGYSSIMAIYLAIALTFSSTIIVIKLLSEKRDLQSLYGKIAVGFLLVQDFVAIGILIFLSGFSKGGLGATDLIMVAVKGLVLVGITLFVSEKIMPKVLDMLARSNELLFIGAIAWCLMVAGFTNSEFVGFNLEIGGFLAGLALANASEQLEIAARVRPLRDFFLTLFFVSLGAGISLGDVGGVIFPALILSVFVLVGNPLIVMAIMGAMRYSRRVSFMASVTVAQISEFSLIVISMAYKVGYVNQAVLTLTTLVGIITMTVSTYLILYSDKLYKILSPLLVIFERKDLRQEKVEPGRRDHVLLFGHNRTGSILRPILSKLADKLIVVDFNPQTVETLNRQGIESVYGDLSDWEIYDDLKLGDAKAVVSTVPDLEDNLQLLQKIKQFTRKPLVIMVGNDSYAAKKLYAQGADYVLVPHSVGGELLAHVFDHHGLDRGYISKYGRAHLEKLN